MRGLIEKISVDVLVVGLGPAGACAAAAAASAGFKVLAIDKKKVAGLPVQCAEFVPSLIGQETQVLKAATHQAISRMETYVETQSQHIAPDFRGNMISRAAFDKALVDEALAAGADCQFGQALTRITNDGNIYLGAGQEVRSRIVIGADGPRSRIGAAIGSVNVAYVESRQITAALLKPHSATDIFLSADWPGGYGWLFPNGNTANIGLGVASAYKNCLKPALEGLHQKLVEDGRVEREIITYTGGLIPVGGMVRPYGNLGPTQVLLAGDAAGLTNPVTGAGINAAVISGRMAGQAAVSHLKVQPIAIENFQEELNDLFGPSLQRALRRRTTLMDTYESNAVPLPHILRQAWIAYPDYWAA